MWTAAMRAARTAAPARLGGPLPPYWQTLIAPAVLNSRSNVDLWRPKLLPRCIERHPINPRPLGRGFLFAVPLPRFKPNPFRWASVWYLYFCKTFWERNVGAALSRLRACIARPHRVRSGSEGVGAASGRPRACGARPHSEDVGATCGRPRACGARPHRVRSISEGVGATCGRPRACEARPYRVRSGSEVLGATCGRLRACEARPYRVRSNSKGVGAAYSTALPTALCSN